MQENNPREKEETIDLLDVVKQLYASRWWVMGSIVTCLSLAAWYTTVAQRIYRADALLQVDYRGKAMDPLEESVAGFNAESPAEGEMDILRSRSVVSDVVGKLAENDPRSNADAVNDFLTHLTVNEKGRNTGVLQLQLLGPDPDRVAQQLDALIAAYIRLDVKRRAAEAERRLNFIETQLPILKQNLDESELALQKYRAQKGNLDIALKAQSLLTRAATIESEQRALQLAMPELRQRFSSTHPSVVTLEKKLARLANERKKVEQEAGALPETELTWLRLNRDVKVASSLYDQLLAKAQELAIWKSGTISKVRIIDPAAVSLQPASPKKGVNLALGFLAGLVLGTLIALVRARLKEAIRNPEILERTFELPVFAHVAFSTKQKRLERVLQKTPQSGPLAHAEPADPAVESMRALRASLQFALTRSSSNVVLLTASRADAGRSFVAVNLACLMAKSGKRVLLVDGDLREGPLAKYFPDAPAGGLSKLLDGGALEECSTETHLPLLRLLPAGVTETSPSDKLCGTRFGEAMTAASYRFDLVLIVAPPVLTFADAASLAISASLTLLVFQPGEHSVRELSKAIGRLKQAGINPSGFIANAVPEAPNAAL